MPYDYLLIVLYNLGFMAFSLNPASLAVATPRVPVLDTWPRLITH